MAGRPLAAVAASDDPVVSGDLMVRDALMVSDALAVQIDRQAVRMPSRTPSRRISRSTINQSKRPTRLKPAQKSKHAGAALIASAAQRRWPLAVAGPAIVIVIKSLRTVVRVRATDIMGRAQFIAVAVPKRWSLIVAAGRAIVVVIK